ncbi:helix-turn-helix domain-containing protein [Flavisolibacter nicotianae]|uniref:helix-turn-helix domain-containing protein n=1 Tax=Flavisolibacter nicotianae TaxID=2364882 RepID=UPI000EAD67A5|nr:helix-turn-helix domain-containing protein [Flavisolibacter nicotianae]
MREWLTMEQAKQLLNYSSRTAVYNFCKAHGVRMTKPRGRVYFSQTELLKAFEKNAIRMGV